MNNQENIENNDNNDNTFQINTENIEKSIAITEKALRNINLEITKWEEIKKKNLEELRISEFIIDNSYFEKDAETQSLKRLKDKKKVIEDYGIENINQSIRNYCEHFEIEFRPKFLFEKVLYSTAGIEGWLRYHNDLN